MPPDRKEGSIVYQKGRRLWPDLDFYATDHQDYSDLGAFRSAIHKAVLRGGKSRDVVSYVHGQNNSFSDGVYRLAQFDHDLNFDEVTIHYS